MIIVLNALLMKKQASVTRRIVIIELLSINVIEIINLFYLNEDLWVLPYGVPHFALNSAFAIVLWD